MMLDGLLARREISGSDESVEPPALGAPPSRADHRAWILIALAGLLVYTTLASLAMGSVSISVVEIGAILMREIGLATPVAVSENHAAVLLSIRLPRVALAMLIGAALGLSGAAMQGIFRNPLVDPGLLGVSRGAALGAVLTIVLGAKFAHGLSDAFAPHVLPISAFAGSLAAMTAAQRIARVGTRTGTATLLLAGIAVNAMAGAFTGLLIYLANDAQLRTITFWSLGSLGGATWKTVGAALLFTSLPLCLMARLGRPLNALLLGEAEALHLGIDVERVRRLFVLLVALAVGASVALAGVLDFVGLIVPHVLRLAIGPDHRVLLPGSALFGASLLMAADVLARTLVTPAELPLGIVTASLGTPFFLALLLRERRRLA